MRAISLFLGCSMLLTACGGSNLVINGRVLDDHGVAVAKAEVVTEPDTDMVMTNQRGYFSLRQRLNELGEAMPLEPGTYIVRVRKFGFQDVNAKVEAKKGEVKVPDLIMKPKTPDIGDATPDATEERNLGADDTSTPIIGI